MCHLAQLISINLFLYKVLFQLMLLLLSSSITKILNQKLQRKEKNQMGRQIYKCVMMSYVVDDTTLGIQKPLQFQVQSTRATYISIHGKIYMFQQNLTDLSLNFNLSTNSPSFFSLHRASLQVRVYTFAQLLRIYIHTQGDFSPPRLSLALLCFVYIFRCSLFICDAAAKCTDWQLF